MARGVAADMLARASAAAAYARRTGCGIAEATDAVSAGERYAVEPPGARKPSGGIARRSFLGGTGPRSPGRSQSSAQPRRWRGRLARTGAS